MKKSSLLFFGCALMLLAAAPLYGQTGCTDSPEVYSFRWSASPWMVFSIRNFSNRRKTSEVRNSSL